MIIKQPKWYMVTGRPGSGKTYWIRAHLRTIPQSMLHILDYNGNDYQEFKQADRCIAKVTEDIDDFLWRTYRKGNCVVVLGDCDSYIRVNEMSQIKKTFINTARNRGITCILDAKRVKNLPLDVRGRVNYSVIFQKTEDKDIQAHEEWACESKGFFNGLRKLRVGEHVVYDHDVSQLMKGRKVS